MSDSSSPLNNNQTWKINEEIADSKLVPVEDKYALPSKFAGEPEYSTVKECARYARRGKYKPSKTNKELKTGTLDFTAVVHIYSTELGGGIDGFAGGPVPSPRDSITPYACFYGSSAKMVKEGWLDKLSPQGYVVMNFDKCEVAYSNFIGIGGGAVIQWQSIWSACRRSQVKFPASPAKRIRYEVG